MQCVFNWMLWFFQRDNTVKSFREGKVWVLICTELLARGVDFKGVNMVINYDFPPSAISYIHRIGIHIAVNKRILLIFELVRSNWKSGPPRKGNHLFHHCRLGTRPHVINLWSWRNLWFDWFCVSRIASLLVNSGCEVPEYIMKLNRANKTERRERARKAPKRKLISTEPTFEREKRQKIQWVLPHLN